MAISFYLLDGLILIVGVLMLTAETSDTQTISRRLRQRLNLEHENVFLGTKYFLSKAKYQAICFGIFALVLILSLISYSKVMLVMAVIFIIASYPHEFVKGKYKLPFHYFCQMIRRLERDKKDEELFRAISLLKNMSVLQRDNPLSADNIIEQLGQMAIITKPAYIKMLGLLRRDKKEEAKAAFVSEIGTEVSKQMANLLVSMDDLNPADLEATIEMYQAHIMQVKITRETVKDELISDLIYIPVVANALAVTVNFVVVVYYLDQKDVFNVLINF